MDFFIAIFLGGLQGITEFLPISSSGHLFLAQKWLGFSPDLSLEIWLHLASIVAVCIFFRSKIFEILRNSFDFRVEPDKKNFGWKLLLATATTAPIALAIKFSLGDFAPLTENFVAISLLATGILIFFSEKFRPSSVRKFSWKIAAILGLAQGLAVLPGISRAGITIAFLIASGIEKKQAAEISFLLAIPTIFGATIASGESLDFSSSENWIAAGASFFAAILTIKFMLAVIQKYWLQFAVYCVFAAIFVVFV